MVLITSAGSANPISVYWRETPSQMDICLATFMRSDRSYFKDLGDIPNDPTVDSVLPEMVYGTIWYATSSWRQGGMGLSY